MNILNREIRADNALIRELKALIAKLMKAVKITLAEIARAKAKFDGLCEQAAEFDRDELTDARLALRQGMESAAHDRIKRNIKVGKVSIRDYWSSISDADTLLDESGMVERRREQRRREERDHRQRKQRPQK